MLYCTVHIRLKNLGGGLFLFFFIFTLRLKILRIYSSLTLQICLCCTFFSFSPLILFISTVYILSVMNRLNSCFFFSKSKIISAVKSSINHLNKWMCYWPVQTHQDLWVSDRLLSSVPLLEWAVTHHYELGDSLSCPLW